MTGEGGGGSKRARWGGQARAEGSVGGCKRPAYMGREGFQDRAMDGCSARENGRSVRRSISQSVVLLALVARSRAGQVLVEG